MTEQKREAELPVADIPLIADLQRHVDEIGHTEIGQDISAAIDVIRSLAAPPIQPGEIIRGEEGSEIGLALAEARKAGWLLVPRSPTDAMMQAGLYQSSHDAEWNDVYSSWVDMVDAAQNELPDVLAALSPNKEDGNNG